MSFFDLAGYDCWWYCTTLYEEGNYRRNPENIWAYLRYTVCDVDVLALPRDRGYEVTGLLPLRDGIDWHHIPLHPSNFRDGVKIVLDR